MASSSTRYTIRQTSCLSVTRNSWHRFPMERMGLECGICSCSPLCSRRSRNPASTRASTENGGVFTSPCNHTSGLSVRCLASTIFSPQRQLDFPFVVDGFRHAPSSCRRERNERKKMRSLLSAPGGMSLERTVQRRSTPFRGYPRYGPGREVWSWGNLARCFPSWALMNPISAHSSCFSWNARAGSSARSTPG